MEWSEFGALHPTKDKKKSYLLKYNHSVKNYGRLCDRTYNANNSYHD